MIKTIFNFPVGIYDIDTSEEINKSLIDTAIKCTECMITEEAFNTLYSTSIDSFIGAHHPLFNRIHLYSSFPMSFLQQVMDCIKSYFETTNICKFGFPGAIPYIDKSWCTIIDSSDNIGTHNHVPQEHAQYGPILSLAYYPDDMLNKGNLKIGDMTYADYDPELKKFKRENYEIIETKKSRLIVFPSYVYHLTENNSSEHRRISYSFDINLVGTKTFLPPPDLMAELYHAFNQELEIIGENR